MKPRLFIGSSAESLSIAYAIQSNLERRAEVTVWDQDIFEPSNFILNGLLDALNKFDFGIFVFSPDDILKIRDKNFLATRDNVLFELGLFIGRFGRERSFIVIPRDVQGFHLPTDLLGLTMESFDPNRQDHNLKAALGPACNHIANMLKKFEEPNHNTTRDAWLTPKVTGGKYALGIDLPQQFALQHFLGNTAVLIFINLINLGDKTISLTKMNCVIKHESGHQWNLIAQSYISRQPPGQPGQNPPQYPIIRITLKAGESWNENVRFTEQWSEAKQDEINEIVFNTRNNVEMRQKGQVTQDTLAEVDDELQRKTLTLFEREFDIRPGNYQAFIAAIYESNTLLSLRGFNFSIFENSIKALRARTIEGYKYGAGVYFPNNHPEVFMGAQIHPLDDETALKLYEASR